MQQSMIEFFMDKKKSKAKINYLHKNLVLKRTEEKIQLFIRILGEVIVPFNPKFCFNCNWKVFVKMYWTKYFVKYPGPSIYLSYVQMLSLSLVFLF